MLEVFFILMGISVFVTSDLSETAFQQNKSPLIECTFKILKTIQEYETIILFKNVSINLDEELQQYKLPLAILNLQRFSGEVMDFEYNLHLIIIEKVQDFEEIILSIEGTGLWNPKGKFLVSYTGSEDIASIFYICWRKYIININILQKNGDDIGIYTYFPFTNDMCLENNLDKKLFGKCGENIRNFFPMKIPNVTEQCELRTAGNIYPPFTKDPFVNEEDAMLGGFEVAMISIFANRLKLNRTNNATKSAFGQKLRNGSYSGILKLIAEGGCDVAYGHLVPNSSNLNDLDTTYYYFQDTNSWHVPSAVPGKQWKAMILIFEPNLWITIGIILVINTLTWWFFGKFSNDTKEFNFFVWCALHSWYSLLLGSVKLPLTLKLRFLVIIWTFFSLILATLYQSQLVSMLLKPVYEHQISNSEELLNSSLKIWFINDFITVRIL